LSTEHHDALPTDGGPERFLEAYEALVRPLTIQHARAYWDFSCSGKPEAQDVVLDTEEQLSDIHASASVYSALLGWREEAEDQPLLARQLQVLLPEYRKAQVDEGLRKRLIRLSLKIEETWSLFRPELGGQRVSSNELDRVLLDETDEARRREAWQATRAIGGRVQDWVRSLVDLRNQQAQELGFSDYYALALDDEAMSPETTDVLLEELCDKTDLAWARLKESLDAEHAARRGKTPDELMPWDFDDRFLQSLPRHDSGVSLDAWFSPTAIQRHAQGYYRSIGLPIDRLWAASDMLPRDTKYPHAFCIGIDSPTDVRVLCNLDGTARWMETTLHEFGHALYNSHIDPQLPWLLRESAHTFITEAVAMFFGRLAKEPSWLEHVAGVPAEQAERVHESQRANQLVFVRWALVVSLFERAMYADPSVDLNALWGDRVGRLQGLRRPEGWDEPDWASKVHIACYPAYYQNYLLGELLASQFQNALQERGADASNPRAVGSFFKQLFSLGQSLPWSQTVQQHTGQPLAASHWLEHFAGA